MGTRLPNSFHSGGWTTQLVLFPCHLATYKSTEASLNKMQNLFEEMQLLIVY